METIDVLNLVFRWLHILAAITAVGGTIFARFVVFPALEPLPAEQRSSIHAAMRARWSKIVAAAIGFLLISGLYNFGVLVATYKLPRWYHPVFGIKFLLALAIFMLASLLSGRTAAAEKLRQNARFWLNLNILLAVIVVCLSGVLRTAQKVPKTLEEPPRTETSRRVDPAADDKLSVDGGIPGRMAGEIPLHRQRS
jgi:uncharacterized membrane protein